MAIVQNLVCKTLRGGLEIDSTVGVGTVIEINLPRTLPVAGE